MKPRRPKDIDRYASAEKAALWLEGLAANIRRNAGDGDVYKVTVEFKVWNEDQGSSGSIEATHSR